mmetsp:Transcript_26928/g.66374  ORF Transcript_26928/g.66374 Transcript_26928/m.66374 type:complete len:223 (-) Transcript_26928:1192-1860(-)
MQSTSLLPSLESTSSTSGTGTTTARSARPGSSPISPSGAWPRSSRGRLPRPSTLTHAWEGPSLQRSSRASPRTRCAAPRSSSRRTLPRCCGRLRGCSSAPRRRLLRRSRQGDWRPWGSSRQSTSQTPSGPSPGSACPLGSSPQSSCSTRGGSCGALSHGSWRARCGRARSWGSWRACGRCCGASVGLQCATRATSRRRASPCCFTRSRRWGWILVPRRWMRC